MVETYALVCGCDYSGNWRIYQSCNDSKKFYKILTDIYKINENNIHKLYDNQYTRSNILKELVWLAEQLDGPGKSGIIYVAGHGTQTADTTGDEIDGQDENWQTYDRQNVCDDEITEIFEKTHKDSSLTIISDCCHSGSMLDFIEKENNIYSDRNWVSIGSALDNQSAIQAGDGSICSFELFKIINETPLIKIGELKVLLKNRMEKSFIGTMQTCVFHISNNEIYKKNLFMLN